MALYRVDSDGDGVVAVGRYHAENGLYEREVETLLWENLDDLVGMPLFRVARQAVLPHGGKPDIVALDETGRLVVIEVKRDVDRNVLAQALEYAGWARTSNLQEVASLYGPRPDDFWADWQEFTGTEQPVLVSPNPHVVLAAASFHERTESAVAFLQGGGVPITVLSITMFRQHDGEKFLDIDRRETVFNVSASTAVVDSTPRVPRKTHDTSVADLVEASLLTPGERLTWTRPRKGDTFEVAVEPDGQLRLTDGHHVGSLSKAAAAYAGGSHDGWECWRKADGTLLFDLRKQFEALEHPID